MAVKAGPSLTSARVLLNSVWSYYPYSESRPSSISSQTVWNLEKVDLWQPLFQVSHWFCGQVERVCLRHSYLLFSIWHIGNWQLHLHESRRTEIKERTWWFVSLSAITILKISLSQKKFLLNSACQYYMSEVCCICTHYWKAQSQHVFSNDHFLL